MDILKLFGKRCRERRESLGLSQEEFSLSINMDRTYYSSIENGKRNVSLKNIEKISKGLKASIAELLKE